MGKIIPLILSLLILSGCSSSPWNSSGQLTNENGGRVTNPQPIPVTGNVSATVTGANITFSVNVSAPNPLPVTGTVGVSSLPAITGTVAVSNFPTAQTVNGTVGIQQNVIADPNNSSITNIAPGGNFTGNATSTLGIADIQVSVKSDQDMIVYVQQSPDGTHWDIQDTYEYLYSKGGASWDTKAVNSYYRVIVVHANGLLTTYFRLQSALLPVGEPLPRATHDGRLTTETTITDDYGFTAENTPFNELRIAQSVKLSGATFQGSLIDPNFWTTNTSANGSVYQSGGQLYLTTNTTANGASRISSLKRARFVAGNSNYFRTIIHFPDAGTVNNVRRWGIADYSTITSITDGAYFQLSGTTLSVVTLNNGTANVTSSGSFNGNYGTVYHLDSNVAHVYEIYYSPLAVYFTVDEKILHTQFIGATPWSRAINLFIYIDNVNSSGSTTDVVMHVWVATIHRFGPTQSAPRYIHINSAVTTVAKYNAGTLQSVTINAPTNSTIDIYDNTAGSGTLIAHLNLGNNTTPFTLIYGLDFYTGLTIVSSGTADFTVQYE